MSTGITRAAAIGALSGVRTFAGIAAVSHALTERPECARGTAQRILARSGVARGLTLAALGESISDKMPFMPPRTDPMPLAGRMVFGASAAAAAADRGTSRLAAALVGAAFAVGAAHLAYQLRTRISAAGTPSALVGLAEDVTVLEGAAQIAAEL